MNFPWCYEENGHRLKQTFSFLRSEEKVAGYFRVLLTVTIANMIIDLWQIPGRMNKTLAGLTVFYTVKSPVFSVPQADFIMARPKSIIFKCQCTCKQSRPSDLEDRPVGRPKPQLLEQQSESRGREVSACTPSWPWLPSKGTGLQGWGGEPGPEGTLWRHLALQGSWKTSRPEPFLFWTELLICLMPLVWRHEQHDVLRSKPSFPSSPVYAS